MFTLGLKADGTVVIAGAVRGGLEHVLTWKNIYDISAGSNHAIGVNGNGDILAAGGNIYGQCNVAGWKLH